jgi:hypothetical protein
MASHPARELSGQGYEGHRSDNVGTSGLTRIAKSISHFRRSRVGNQPPADCRPGLFAGSRQHPTPDTRHPDNPVIPDNACASQPSMQR